MCWLIEGTGFQAAMARAVLAGMRFLVRAPYARRVCVDLSDALTWLCALLDGSTARAGDVPTGAMFIPHQLAAKRPSAISSAFRRA